MKKPLTSRLIYTWTFLTIAAVGLSGSQCARVSDNATGPESGLLNHTPDYAACIKSCNDAAFAARRAEIALYLTNKKACETPECKEAEEARHEAAMEQIDMDQEACKMDCHEQGTGSGGE